MAAWNDLFDASLTEIGVLEAGGTGATADRTHCLGVMNRMLGRWSAELGPIYFETTESLTWASGNASRTIGSSGDFNTGRPQKVLAAQYRIGDVDYDLTLISHQEYQAISNKAFTSARPSLLAYNPTNSSSLGTLFIHPVPSSSLTFRLTSYKPFTVITDQTATVVFPPGYEEAIVLNLATLIARHFGRQPSGSLILDAQNSKAAIVQANLVFQPSTPDPLTPGAGNGYDPLDFLVVDP